MIIVRPSLGSLRVLGVSNVTRDYASLFLDGRIPKVSITLQLSLAGLLEVVGAEASVEEPIKVPRPVKIERVKKSEANETAQNATVTSAENATTTDTDTDDALLNATNASKETKETKEKEDEKESVDGEGAKPSTESDVEPKSESPSSSESIAAPAESDWIWRNKTHRFPLLVETEHAVDMRALNETEKSASLSL